MDILPLVFSVIALVIALASVWFTSEAIKKATTDYKNFYEANIKVTIRTIEDVAKVLAETNAKVNNLEIAAKNNDVSKIGPQITALEKQFDEMRAVLQDMKKRVPGSPKQMYF
jgi:uncharacterized protein Yka (UPF0111/DUF47 family)